MMIAAALFASLAFWGAVVCVASFMFGHDTLTHFSFGGTILFAGIAINYFDKYYETPTFPDDNDTLDG